MSFALAELRALTVRVGPVARVVVAEIAGSTPREVGAAMAVWARGQSGTIGGGALEFEAAATARALLAAGGGSEVARHALGPGLGQCCGGAVTLVTERWEAAPLAALDPAAPVARRLDGPAAPPLAIARALNLARSRSSEPGLLLADGWIVEAVSRPTRPVWIWGAGHVGRALVEVLAPLPDLALTWIDTAADRFPGKVPACVTAIPAAEPARLVPRAPADAQHVILTYSHALDLELCHQLLGHGFAGCGLIGSATKWARFRSRLTALGHAPERIGRIQCPIGDPRLGKHPQAIAVGTAAELLASAPAKAEARRA